MDIFEARQHVQNVENGLKLALLVVGGIAGAISLIALIGAAAASRRLQEQETKQPCDTC